MNSVQRLINTRPDRVVRSNTNVVIPPSEEGKTIIYKWSLYWGERIPGQEVDQIMIADSEGSQYIRFREIEGRPFTPEVIEQQMLTPEEVTYFTKLAEEYEPE
jgi:hypothetical protein